MHLPYFDQDTKKLVAPHVVILGAGASKAAFPSGDKYGKKVPLMNDLIKVLGLEKSISKHGLKEYIGNFELLYSNICENSDLVDLKELINKKVEKYFKGFTIPDTTTLYDYLILSLKEKDLIATFNWDPFLLQAYRRNIKVGNLPKIAFLHGNVYLGVCEKDKALGYLDCLCNKCGNKLNPIELLFPIAHKDYNNNTIIKSQWDMLSFYLDFSYYLTIFGYSAPKSDVEAIEIMKKAWKGNESVNLAQIEVIDIKEREEIIKNWEEFTVGEHYGIRQSLKESWLWHFPRESGEALFDATLQNSPIKSFPFEENSNLEVVQEFARNINIRKLKI